MKTKSLLIILVLVIAGLMTSTSQASVTAGTNLFSRGHSRLSIYGGAAGALNETYFLLGAGAGYFITNGLELGVDGEWWSGNDPNIYKVTPQLRFVFYRATRLIPYAGVFYRRTIYEGLTDLDSYGGRIGLYTQMGGKAYAGAGFVYEQYVDCNDNIYSSCSTTYPEISISIGF